MWTRFVRSELSIAIDPIPRLSVNMVLQLLHIPTMAKTMTMITHNVDCLSRSGGESTILHQAQVERSKGRTTNLFWQKLYVLLYTLLQLLQ